MNLFDSSGPKQSRLEEWHPHSAAFPLLTGAEKESFTQDIAANGQKETVKYRVVAGKRQGLDGRNREQACLELGISCRYEEVFVEDGDVEAYIDSLNLHRRHLTPEDRKRHVRRLRRAGKSTREIAQATGVAQSTVMRDLQPGDANESPVGDEGSGEPNGSRDENERIVGRDGKSYPANLECDLEPVLPERLKPFFEHVPLFQKAERLASTLADVFQTIEQTPAYQAAIKGRQHKIHSTYVRSAGMAVGAMAPNRACPNCGGEHEPSQDNDPCRGCGGKGYQTSEEAAK